VGERVVAALIEFLNLTSDQHVLEIGVGTGRIAKPLAATLGNHQLFGIDISRKMMGRLRESLPAEVKPPALVEANALRLPFPSQTFQAILTVHVLHLIREWRELLVEMERVRAPGGVFIGGWNDHPPESSGERISHKFRELAAEHGISIERQGIVMYRDVLNHLTNARATEITAAEWTIERPPRLALQSIAERHFSSSWLIPDDLYPAIYAELEAWAKKEWPDLDQAILEQRGFKWMKIEF
jgi:SAM-dependent methyltransferase